MNKDFKFALAIKGSETQLKHLADKMVEMGYVSIANNYESMCNICTSWEGLRVYLFGYNAHPNSPYHTNRHHISFDTHSEECIMALLAARKDGEFESNELVVDNNYGTLDRVIKGAFYHKDYFTRPTFDQIVAHFTPKEHIVSITVNADEWKALNDKAAELHSKVELLEEHNTKLISMNERLVKLVDILKPEPIEPEWIPFDADKWSGKVEDIKHATEDVTIHAARWGNDTLAMIYGSGNYTTNSNLTGAQRNFQIRNPNYINPPITC